MTGKLAERGSRKGGSEHLQTIIEEKDLEI